MNQFTYGKKKVTALLKILLNIIYRLVIENCFRTGVKRSVNGVHLQKENSAHYIVSQKLYVIYLYEYC